MARSRNIKPSIFKNELLGQADPLLTILFVGLWTIADRRGVLEDRPLRIKAEVFPYRDGTDVAGYLTELERLGFIERYEAAGKKLIHIPNFTKHQSPHPTEKPSELPGIEEKDQQKQDSCFVTVTQPLSNVNVHDAAALIPYSLNPESLPPESGKRASDSKESSPVSLETFIAQCKQRDEKVISEYAPLWDYAKKTGLPAEWIQVAWRTFRRRHATSGKRYKDWRRTFKNCIEGNWLKLWYFDATGNCLMSSNGFAEQKFVAADQEAA